MFPILNFEQTNPAIAAMKYMAQMQNQRAQTQQTQIQNQYLPQSLAEQLRGAGIGNDLKANELQYAPQMSQATLRQLAAQTGLMGAETGEANARIPLYGAQANLAQQEAKYFPYTAAAGMDPITKMLAGRHFAQMLQQQGSLGGAPQGGGQQPQPGAPQMPGGGVLTPQGQPQQQAGMNQIPNYLLRQPQLMNQGQPPASIAQPQQAQQQQPPMTAQSSLQGGAPQMAPQQPQAGGAPQMQNLMQQLGASPSVGGGQGGSIYDQLYAIQMKNQIAALTKDPTMGSQRSGAGGTYTDPSTGGQYSTDVTRNTGLDQQTIGAIQRVKPLLKDLTDNLGPFQTFMGQSALGYEKTGNYILGHDNPLPRKYAIGQAALKTAPEGLLKAWGLNVTDESQKAMREAVQPINGESAKGYENRIVHQLQQMQENENQAKKRLKEGTQLDEDQENNYKIDDTKTVGGKKHYLINGDWYE